MSCISKHTDCCCGMSSLELAAASSAETVCRSCTVCSCACCMNAVHLSRDINMHADVCCCLNAAHCRLCPGTLLQEPSRLDANQAAYLCADRSLPFVSNLDWFLEALGFLLQQPSADKDKSSFLIAGNDLPAQECFPKPHSLLAAWALHASKPSR